MKGVYATIAAALLSQLVGAVPPNTNHQHQSRISNSTPDADGNKLGAVSSETKECTQIGINALRSGGNAADALVSTVFCIGVIGMYHSGIGGGGFMTVRAPNGSYEVINFRETAPAAAFQDMYKNNTNASIFGGLASGVPGEVRGLAMLHEKYGVLPWADLVTPAAQIAYDGFEVSSDLVRYMKSATAGQDNFLVNNPTWAIDFAPNGTQLGLGDIITRKRYAATLMTIAEQGPEAFYTGPIAETMIDAIQAANGTMTLDDLKNYTAAIQEPIAISYRGRYRIHSAPAPASGAVLGSVFNIIDGYPNIGSESAVNLSTHRLDEALRFGYGQRTELGDPYFVANMTAYQASMLSNTTAMAVRAKISDLHTLNVSAYDPSGFESLATPGTSAVATADNTGLAVSLTTTVNLLFGSQLMVPETGIIMNNEMNDFSIPGSSNAFGYIPSPSNYIRPGKRPVSSIVPTIVEHINGSLYVVIGAAGGSRIITSTIQSIWHILDSNKTTYEALAAPRLHDQLVPNLAVFEYAYDNETVAFMKGRGHNVTWITPNQSAVSGLRLLPNGTFEAAGEPRQLNSLGDVI